MTSSWLSNFCFGVSSTNLTQIKHPLCNSDKSNVNELFVSDKYGLWRPLLTTIKYPLKKKTQFASASKDKRHRFCVHSVPFIDRQTFKSAVKIKAMQLMGSCINTKPKNKIYACSVKKTLFSFVQKEILPKKERLMCLLLKLCRSGLVIRIILCVMDRFAIYVKKKDNYRCIFVILP